MCISLLVLVRVPMRYFYYIFKYGGSVTCLKSHKWCQNQDANHGCLASECKLLNLCNLGPCNLQKKNKRKKTICLYIHRMYLEKNLVTVVAPERETVCEENLRPCCVLFILFRFSVMYTYYIF